MHAGERRAARLEAANFAHEDAATLAQLQRWVNGATRSPVERLKRERMRELLGVNTIQGLPHER